MIGTTRLTGPDGEDLILLFDHAARLAAEDAADAPLQKVVEGAFQGRLGHLGCLLYGGLRRNHPRLTLNDSHALVAKAIDGKVLLGLQEGLLKALEASLPKPDANPPKAPGSGTGTPSSEPGAKKGSSRTRSGGRRPAASR